MSNRRSLLFSGNLADAIAKCVTAPEAAGQTFLIRDGVDLSTPEIVLGLGHALGTDPNLINIPVGWLKLAGAVTGRRAAIGRLLGSLAVEDSKLRRTLDWQPPYSWERGFAATATWYLQSARATI